MLLNREKWITFFFTLTKDRDKDQVILSLYLTITPISVLELGKSNNGRIEDNFGVLEGGRGWAEAGVEENEELRIERER